MVLRIHIFEYYISNTTDIAIFVLGAVELVHMIFFLMQIAPSLL